MLEKNYTLKEHITHYSFLKYGHDSWTWFEQLSPEIKANYKEHGTLEGGILFWNEGGTYEELSEKEKKQIVNIYRDPLLTHRIINGLNK